MPGRGKRTSSTHRVVPHLGHAPQGGGRGVCLCVVLVSAAAVERKGRLVKSIPDN